MMWRLSVHGVIISGASKINKEKFNNVNLNLRGSYYMIDYVAIGGGLSYGGGEFGSTRTEVHSPNTNDISKSSISGYNAGIGYYAFFAEETALKICTYYQAITVKNKDSGDKFRYKGFRAEVGISHAF